MPCHSKYRYGLFVSLLLDNGRKLVALGGDVGLVPRCVVASAVWSI